MEIAVGNSWCKFLIEERRFRLDCDQERMDLEDLVAESTTTMKRAAFWED